MTEKDSLLTNELILSIRKCIMKGYNYVQTREELDINENTWDTWYNRDYKGIRSKLAEWKRAYMIHTAEEFSKNLMSLKAVDEQGKNDKELLRVQQKEAEFLRETVGKDEGYTKRAEQTGKDGMPLAIVIDNAIADKHNLHATNTSTEDNSIEQ